MGDCRASLRSRAPLKRHFVDAISFDNYNVFCKSEHANLKTTAKRVVPDIQAAVRHADTTARYHRYELGRVFPWHPTAPTVPRPPLHRSPHSILTARELLDEWSRRFPEA